MKSAILALLLMTAPLYAGTHEVRMYSRSDNGPMIYEPSRLRIAPGDTVRFIPAQPSHNAATIDGMIPAGAAPFKSKINEDFSVTLTVPGAYGIKCSPHFAMGMVMLIEVAEAGMSELPAPTLPENLPKRALARFKHILADQP